MSSYVLGFQDIDKTKLKVFGGKGANLGELSRIEGIRVPEGFCVSTEVFKRIIGETSSINELLDQLSHLMVEDRDKIGEFSGEIRRVIEGIAIPQDINEEITRFLSMLGEKNAADTLSQSVPNNITSEIGLALLDVADVIRPYTEVIDYLQQVLERNPAAKPKTPEGFLLNVKEDNFLDELVKFDGGQETQEAIYAYLDKYGMRCRGEQQSVFCSATSPGCMVEQQAELATRQIISLRKDEYKLYEKLTPPRVITSDGEIIAGEYKRENIPAEAIVGLPVSSGVIDDPWNRRICRNPIMGKMLSSPWGAFEERLWKS